MHMYNVVLSYHIVCVILTMNVYEDKVPACHMMHMSHAHRPGCMVPNTCWEITVSHERPFNLIL